MFCSMSMAPYSCMSRRQIPQICPQCIIAIVISGSCLRHSSLAVCCVSAVHTLQHAELNLEKFVIICVTLLLDQA